MTEVTEAEIAARTQFPRVKPDDLDAQIKEVRYHYVDQTTKCTIIMQNGFTVHGEGACAVPGNYRKDLGERLALSDAKNKMWALLGYELKTKVALAQEAHPASEVSMKTYVGTKVIHASPMNRADYNRLRGWELPADEDGTDEGYLVEYADGDAEGTQRNHHQFRGYISWSPKAVFESAYEEMNVRGEGSEGGLTWRDRLEIEKAELVDKLEKLSAFLGTHAFGSLPQEQQELLTDQSVVMSQYLSILTVRLIA